MIGRATLGRGLLGVLCLLALWVPGAVAAAPANDDFTNAQVLSGPLPIAETGSNLEATKEPEEPAAGSLGFANTGHTVWYEWEASTTGFVTVDTCGGFLRAAIGVYTGTAVAALTEVAGDFASEGPDCPESNGTAVTFRAVSGTKYEIVVDGLLRFFDEEMPGQGSFDLGVDALPPPANDDFAAATVLAGQEENGTYFAGGSSYNWGAGKEAGEPAHAGDPGGASVWFSWTAPATANYGLAACGRGIETVLGAYTGASVDALAPVGSAVNQCNWMRFDATQGTTYHFAVDGRFDSGAGAAEMSAIWINVFRERPEPLFEPQLPPQPTFRRPETTIEGKRLQPKRHRATFTFASSEPGSRFQCSLDSRPFSGCRSPRSYGNLKPGRHLFRVVAVASSSAYDFSPATAHFRVPKALPSR